MAKKHRSKAPKKREWRNIVLYIVTLLIALSMALTYVLIALQH